ncbi:hypothetical protein WMY93_016704 [Mugilogobius chulae]|uniref:Uncharacterized protein n=1 Tax=Mugilogobius chulae TaxID=88201 RepID=A0AAW0NX48_9GOBI
MTTDVFLELYLTGRVSTTMDLTVTMSHLDLTVDVSLEPDLDRLPGPDCDVSLEPGPDCDVSPDLDLTVTCLQTLDLTVTVSGPDCDVSPTWT